MDISAQEKVVAAWTNNVTHLGMQLRHVVNTLTAGWKRIWTRSCWICCNAARGLRFRLNVSWQIIAQNARVIKYRPLCVPTLPRRRTSFRTSQKAFQILLWAKSTRRQVQHVMILANCTISLYTFDLVVAWIRTQTGPNWWKGMLPCVHDSPEYAMPSQAQEFD